VAQLPGVGLVLRLVRAQAEALIALPDGLVALNRSVRALTRSVDQSRETLATVQRLMTRADDLMTELDEPVRALAPGLRRLSSVLDDPVMDEIPSVLRQLQRDLLPVVSGLRDTQQKVTSIASSTARMSTLIDETGSRLSALPGANLLLRPRPSEPGNDAE
jgi:ABC-type transporter Mla subunit MlaD